ncbi:UNVERIFIED_CONTAM: hypothetical protein GTU68_035470, partial [Idotea baltica]|nr:hypothetical protein [Idotea baltica]
MTIGGNIIVLMTVGLRRQLRSTTTILISNLAVADLLLGSTVLPFSAVWTITDLWLFGQVFCNIWTAIDVLCCTASILSLCAISLDRYIGVTYPLKHSRIMTHRRLLNIVMMVWFLSGAISMVPFISWQDYGEEQSCICNVNSEKNYVLFSVSFSFYIPLLIILIVYSRIYVEATKQSKFLNKGIKT